MNRLDRYIFKQGALPFLLILLCTTLVIWLTQVLQRVDLMVEDGGSLLSFLKVTVLLVPSLMVVIMPFAMVAAVLYAINAFAMDSELPVMKAAGASRFRLARPLLALGLLVGAAVLYINADLQPRTYRALKNTEELVKSDLAAGFIREGVFTRATDEITVYAEQVQPGDQYIGLFIHDRTDPDEVKTYTAERGLFRVTASGPKLLLVRATIQYRDPDTGQIEIGRFNETSVDLTAFQGESEQRNLDQTERYVSELLNPDMSNPYDVQRAGRFIAEGHARLSTPLYPVAFGAIALAFMLTAPVSRRGYGRRLMYAIGTVVVLRTGGYMVQNANDVRLSVNLLQYLLPIAATAIGVVIVSGRFWRVSRRRTPRLAAVLSEPAEVRAVRDATA